MLNKTLKEILFGNGEGDLKYPMSGLLFAAPQKTAESDKPQIRKGFLSRQVKSEGDEYRTVSQIEVAVFDKTDKISRPYLSMSIGGGMTHAALYPGNGKYGNIYEGSIIQDGGLSFPDLRIVARPTSFKKGDADLTEEQVKVALGSQLRLEIYEKKNGGAE